MDKWINEQIPRRQPGDLLGGLCGKIIWGQKSKASTPQTHASFKSPILHYHNLTFVRELDLIRRIAVSEWQNKICSCFAPNFGVTSNNTTLAKNSEKKSQVLSYKVIQSLRSCHTKSYKVLGLVILIAQWEATRCLTMETSTLNGG